MAAKTLTARQQFVAEIDGATVVVLPGAPFPIAHVVVAYREYFDPPLPPVQAAVESGKR